MKNELKDQVEKYPTTRIWAQTLKKLRIIHALTGESIVRVMDRLATVELARLEKEKGNV